MGEQPVTHAASLAAFEAIVAKVRDLGVGGSYSTPMALYVAKDRESASVTCPGAKVSYEFFPEEQAMMQVISGQEESCIGSVRKPGKVVIETSATEAYAMVRLLLPNTQASFYVWSDRVVVTTGLGVSTLTPGGRAAGGEVPPGIFPTL